MASAAKAAGVPLEIEHGGKVYKIAPLTEADWSELEAWIQGRAMDRDAALIEKIPDEDLRKQKMAASYEQARRLTVGSEAGLAVLFSSAGAVRAAWVALRRYNDLTLEEVTSLCHDKAFAAKIEKASGNLNSPDPEDLAAAKKNTAKKRRTKKRTRKRKKKK